jgi:Uma2 family endonuclease
MARPANRRATYEDLLEVPAHLVAQIIDGELVTSPRPAPPHALAGSALGGEIMGPFQFGRGGPGGWWVLDEPELHLRGDILVPDLAGWRRARLPAMPSTAFFELSPDWVCEIVSAGSEADDRARKMPIYAREGVPHAWILDPLTRTIESYALESGRWTLLETFRGDTRARVVPFDAIEIDLSVLWTD